MILPVPSVRPPSKLNQRGFDRVLIAVACVVVCGIVGTALVVASHAATTVQWKGVLEAFNSGSNYCLTSSGSATSSKVVLDPCKASDNNQVWSLTDIKTATVLGESSVQEFYLQNGAGTNECLNNPYGSKTNGASMQLYTCKTTDAASIWVWGIKLTSKGLSAHQLINLASISGSKGLCLDDAYGATTGGTKTQVYGCKTSGQSNQSWFEDSAPTNSGSSGTGSKSSNVGCSSGGTAAPCIGSSTTGASGWGTPTFQSIFNGTSINTTQWKVESSAPNNDQEYDCYSPNNAIEGGGYLSLKLTATKCSLSGQSWPDTGAQMTTENSFNQTYGYYEARVYMPGSNGTVANWGAFWLTNNNWPNDGEIDVVEGYHGTAGYHFEYAPSGSATWQGGQASGDYTGWHTYGVNWQANSVTFYYDGKEMGSYTQGASSNHYPMFILLDYTTAPQNDVGGPSVVPDTMQVQYVRAWK